MCGLSANTEEENNKSNNRIFAQKGVMVTFGIIDQSFMIVLKLLL
jgi:hypothetical protein